MGVLANPAHEAFCQDVESRVLKQEKRTAAYVAAYRTHVWGGDKDVADAKIAPNAKRLAQKLAGRRDEIKERAATLASIDKGWGLMHLYSYVEGTIDEKVKISERILAIKLIGEWSGFEAPTKTELTGKDGMPLVPEVSDLEAARRLAFVLERGARAQAETKEST